MITVVLDDDPTGTQAVASVPIVLDQTGAHAWEASSKQAQALPC